MPVLMNTGYVNKLITDASVDEQGVGFFLFMSLTTGEFSGDDTCV